MTRAPRREGATLIVPAALSESVARIEVFTDDGPECREVLDMIEVGKCGKCELVERNVAREPEKHREAAARYGVRTLPTIVVDGRFKVEGKPDFPWVCSDELLRLLEERYALRRGGT